MTQFSLRIAAMCVVACSISAIAGFFLPPWPHLVFCLVSGYVVGRVMGPWVWEGDD